MNFSIIKFIEKNADFVAANNRRAALLRFVLVNSAEKVLAWQIYCKTLLLCRSVFDRPPLDPLGIFILVLII